MTIIIFCIAHKGISQIDYWSSWLPDGVEMRVFCPPGSILPKRALRLPFFFATQWASPQLVYVLQEGYRCILKEFADASMIYLVSGNDIPVSSKLTHTRSQIAFTRSGNGNHQNRKDKVLEIRTKDLNDFGLTAQPSYLATQWIHLTANHARLIADYPLWRMQLLHSKLRQTYDHYGKITPAPDEYWPWTILTQCGVTLTDIDDTICTQQDRKLPDDSSPVTWTSMDTKELIFSRYEDSRPVFECKTLREILRTLPDETLFYRKVSSAVIFSDLGRVVFDK